MKLDRVAFLSRRWLSGRKGGASRFRSGAAAAGLAAGVAALIVILGVMNGLQGGYIDSILEISSFHIRITIPEGGPDPASLALRVAALPGVRSAVPIGETHVMAVGPSGRSSILALRTVPANLRECDPGLVRALGMEGSDNVPVRGGLVMGREASELLGLYEGADVELMGIATDPEEGLSATRAVVPLSGTFKSGYYEFDSTYAFALADDETLPVAAAGKTLVGVKLDNRFRDAQAIDAIRTSLAGENVELQSWRDYNRSFFGALRTEKTVMIMLVGLIFAVVAVNIRHAMRRKVAVRMPEIASLRAMGASAGDLRAVFATEGLATGLAGALAGACVGLLIAYNIDAIVTAAQALAFWFSNLPATLGITPESAALAPRDNGLYMDGAPVRISATETAFIMLAAAGSAVFAASSACSRALDEDPAEVLRNE